jgi:hypothetical protein
LHLGLRARATSIPLNLRRPCQENGASGKAVPEKSLKSYNSQKLGDFREQVYKQPSPALPQAAGG